MCIRDRDVDEELQDDPYHPGAVLAGRYNRGEGIHLHTANDETYISPMDEYVYFSKILSIVFFPLLKVLDHDPKGAVCPNIHLV